MLCFERWDTKAEKKMANKELVLEEDYITGIVTPMTPKRTQDLIDEEAWIWNTCDEVNSGLITQCASCTVHKPKNARKVNYDFSNAIPNEIIVRDDEWVCEKCTTINSDRVFRWKTCKYINLVMKNLVFQKRIAEMGFNSYWETCKRFYSGHYCTLCKENELLYNGIYNFDQSPMHNY